MVEGLIHVIDRSYYHKPTSVHSRNSGEPHLVTVQKGALYSQDDLTRTPLYVPSLAWVRADCSLSMTSCFLCSAVRASWRGLTCETMHNFQRVSSSTASFVRARPAHMFGLFSAQPDTFSKPRNSSFISMQQRRANVSQRWF